MKEEIQCKKILAYFQSAKKEVQATVKRQL